MWRLINMSDYCCSINDCEKNADKVYCPNRFTFEEMTNIKIALDLAPGYLENFVESVKENNTYNDLSEGEKILYNKAPELIEKMDILDSKVFDLVKMAMK